MLMNWKKLTIDMGLALAFGAGLAVVGFLCFRFAVEAPDMLLPILFCGLVVGLQQRTIAKLLRQLEILQTSNLALSRDSSAVAIAHLQTTGQQHQQPQHHTTPQTPQFRS